jgi:hypothetical protein
MFTIAVSVPPKFVAEIVKSVAVRVTVGVPDRTPVIVLKARPDGSDGVIAQLDAAPPTLTPFKFTDV